MRSSWLLLACVLFTLFRGFNSGCGTHKAKDGSVYNLDPLTIAGAYQGTEEGTSYTYFWNFCANYAAQISCSTMPPPASAVQVSSTDQCVNIGYTPATITDSASGPDKGVTITYVNNQDSRCKGGTIERTTVINVECAPGSPTTLVGISEPPSQVCWYIIAMKSQHACPTGKGSIGGKAGGLSGGSVFLIIFFCGAAAYLLIGVVVKWRMGASPGVEMVPNIEFWRSLPGLIMDGFGFLRSKVTGYSKI